MLLHLGLHRLSGGAHQVLILWRGRSLSGILIVFHVRIEVIVFSLLLVVVFFAAIAFPRVRSEGLVHIQAVIMIVLAEEGVWVVYKSSVAPIIQTKEQLHHLGDLPAYLTVRVHFKPT